MGKGNLRLKMWRARAARKLKRNKLFRFVKSITPKSEIIIGCFGILLAILAIHQTQKIADNREGIDSLGQAIIQLKKIDSSNHILIDTLADLVRGQDKILNAIVNNSSNFVETYKPLIVVNSDPIYENPGRGSSAERDDTSYSYDFSIRLKNIGLRPALEFKAELIFVAPDWNKNKWNFSGWAQYNDLDIPTTLHSGETLTFSSQLFLLHDVFVTNAVLILKYRDPVKPKAQKFYYYYRHGFDRQLPKWLPSWKPEVFKIDKLARKYMTIDTW